MVTISKLGSEVDIITIKIGNDVFELSELSNKKELFKAVKELSRVLLLNQLKLNGVK